MFKKQLILNITSNFLSALPQFLISILVGLLISPNFLGQFTYYLAIAYLISTPLNFGYSVIGLIYLQKKYLNIISLFIFYSIILFLPLIIISLVINNGLIYLFSILYVILINFKELLNSFYAINNNLIRKLYYNIFDLSGVILSVIFVKYSLLIFDYRYQIWLFFICLSIFKIFVFLFFVKVNKRYLSLSFVKKYLKFKKLIFIYKISSFNQINALFTNIYSQGYYIVLGMFLTFEIVSLVKYINLVQTIISLLFNSFIQLKTKVLVSVNRLKKELKGIIILSELYQFSTSFFCALVFVFFDVFQRVFNIQVFNKYFIVFLMLAFLFNPLKQILALRLISLNNYFGRTFSIIISVLLCSPLLYFIKYSVWFLPVFILVNDLIVSLLFYFLIHKTKINESSYNT